MRFTGIWPPDPDLDAADFEVPIEAWIEDLSDLARSHDRQRERCRLAIRQGLERANFQLRLGGEQIEASETAS